MKPGYTIEHMNPSDSLGDGRHTVAVQHNFSDMMRITYYSSMRANPYTGNYCVAIFKIKPKQ